MEGIEVEQLPLSQTRSKDLANLIIDFDDESCQNYDLHLSAYQGEHDRLKYLLQDQDIKSHINDRIRPYLSTPLRLAATGFCLTCLCSIQSYNAAGHLDSLRVLIENGASLEAIDVKSQTALFTALVNRHWDCVEYLLSVGANPNGNDQNLCSPLSVMAQRGYYEGIKLLCTWGADTEDFYRLLSGLPSLPLTICTTYHHFKEFSLLLLFGAKPDLGPSYRSSHPMIVDNCNTSLSGTVMMYRQIIERCSVPHTIIKHKCPPEFVYLYYEFGGNLCIKDSKGLMATEISDQAPGLEIMKILQETPLSLQSICRLTICRSLMHDLEKIKSLPLNSKLIHFLLYMEIANSINQIPKFEKSDQTVFKYKSRALPIDWVIEEELQQQDKVVETLIVDVDGDNNNNRSSLDNNQGNIPPPPPLPPPPSRPHFIQLSSNRVAL
ncbi:unnamed protein product [Lepeophtheirus salmonis]|uniref:(salmon louse) hypothetical protein n=1 Tax=Lepeophtheirus salmonis TaxID=72036 RepID=A0A7R8D4F0_LEPSM|nr:unnamed protein product [Lepeophtheirus salmonis]CAF2972315.1 unnamed protein product [Lepeophtheirus salmonis]